MKHRKILLLAILACVLVFCMIVIFSNSGDWDYFFTTVETDLRSWVIDFRPPLWSYQFCAGVSRFGDPQSFAFSPLFLPIIVFGSFWGSKVLMIGCTLAGFVYLGRILSLLDPVADGDSRLIHYSLSLFVVFGNYFLSHFQEGHLTFVLMPFAFVPAYYFLKCIRSGLNRPETVALFASGFAFCTAGLYHALVFLAVPVLLLGLPAALIGLLRTRKLGIVSEPTTVRRLSACGLILLAILACSAFRIYGVWSYQVRMPRPLEALHEGITLIDLVVYLFLPTWNYHILGFLIPTGPWRIHEYSAFGALPWIAVVIAVMLLLRRMVLRKRDHQLWGYELALAFLGAMLLCMGDDSPVPLFRWMDRGLYGGAIRVSGRFEILLLLIAALFILRAVAACPEIRRLYVRRLAPAGLAITLASLLTFLSNTSFAIFARILSDPVAPVREMRSLVWVRDPQDLDASGDGMYPVVKAGKIVFNCYNPLGRMEAVGIEKQGFHAAPGTIGLLEAGAKPLSRECVRSAFVTQNELHFDPAACPGDLCFNVNELNPYAAKKLVWNRRRDRFCIEAE